MKKSFILFLCVCEGGGGEGYVNFLDKLAKSPNLKKLGKEGMGDK